MSHVNPARMRSTARSEMTVASGAGTPRRRIHAMPGAKAAAKMRASTSGIVTSVSCRLTQMSPVASRAMMMIWSERVARRPNASPHSFAGLSGASRPSVTAAGRSGSMWTSRT
jgi:hypothetical protein